MKATPLASRASEGMRCVAFPHGSVRVGYAADTNSNPVSRWPSARARASSAAREARGRSRRRDLGLLRGREALEERLRACHALLERLVLVLHLRLLPPALHEVLIIWRSSEMRNVL
jgi:hypothetical protein